MFEIRMEKSGNVINSWCGAGVNPINMVYNFQMKEIGPPGTRWKLGMRVFKKKQRSMGSHKKVTIFADTTYTCMMMALRAGGGVI